MFNDLNDEAMSHLEEIERLEEELKDPKFKYNNRYNVGKTILGWNRRNVEAARVTLKTVPDLMNLSRADLEGLRDDLSFHLVNYTTSLTAFRDYLFSWSKELPECGIRIDKAAMKLKKTPSVKVIVEFRNRLNHGAMVVDGLKMKMRTPEHPEGPGFDLLPTLTDSTLSAIREVDAAIGNQISNCLDLGKDWLSPLLSTAQTCVEIAWDEAGEAFRAVHGTDLDRQKFLINRIPELNELFHATIRKG